jgi:hypothetical protein
MNDYQEESRLRMAVLAADDYKSRKAARTAYYKRFVEGWKSIPCFACGGGGLYDNTDRHGRQPKCGACNGTGKERVSPEDYKRYIEMERRMEIH